MVLLDFGLKKLEAQSINSRVMVNIVYTSTSPPPQQEEYAGTQRIVHDVHSEPAVYSVLSSGLARSTARLPGSDSGLCGSLGWRCDRYRR